MKKTILQHLKGILFFLGLALNVQLFAQATPASEITEETTATVVTEPNWKVFEGTVNTYLTNKGTKYATQVSLDVYLDNATTPTKRIVADVLFMNGTRYQVGDAKASVSKDLAGAADLTSVCTANQKVIYPAINLVKGTVTKVVVKGGVNLAAINLAVDRDITTSFYTAAKTGVQFFVTKPAAAYTTAPFPRYMVL